MLYRSDNKGFAIFKPEAPALEPDIQAYLQDPERRELLNRLGREGWELVSVQPLECGKTKIGNHDAQGWGCGIALPTGYLLFFKRSLRSD